MPERAGCPWYHREADDDEYVIGTAFDPWNFSEQDRDRNRIKGPEVQGARC